MDQVFVISENQAILKDSNPVRCFCNFLCSQRQFSAGSYDSVDINDFLFEDDYDSEPTTCALCINNIQV